MNKKESVKKLYEVIFNEHDLSRCSEFIKDDYIQHNPTVCDGLTGFIHKFEEHFKQQPGFHSEIKHLIEEGDYVVVHAHATGVPGEKGAAVVDIYRFEDDKIAEHWDVLQKIPDQSVNDNGMF